MVPPHLSGVSRAAHPGGSEGGHTLPPPTARSDMEVGAGAATIDERSHLITNRRDLGRGVDGWGYGVLPNLPIRGYQHPPDPSLVIPCLYPPPLSTDQFLSTIHCSVTTRLSDMNS